MELILIRHGLPLRVEKTDGSPANPELSNEGMDQVERLVRWMKDEKLDAIYCSPLMRAKRRGLQRNAAVVLENVGLTG